MLDSLKQEGTRKKQLMIDTGHPKITFVATIIVTILALLFAAAVIGLFWNLIIYTVFHGPAISFAQAFIGVTVVFLLNNIRLAYKNKGISRSN